MVCIIWDAMEDVRLKELVSTLRSKSSGCDMNTVVERAQYYVLQRVDKRAHSYLCTAALQREDVGGKRYSDFLHCLGPVQTLLVVYTNISRVPLSTAHWLAKETISLLDGPTLTSLLYSQCCISSPALSPEQQQLLSALTRMPDCLANKLARSLPPSLLPHALYSRLGNALLDCLHKIHSDLKGGQLTDCSLAFPEAVLSKIAILGHADTLLSQLVPTLELRSRDDALWQHICRSLFCHVTSSALDAVLTALVHLVSPSLATPHPLYLLLGDLVLTNHRARHILTHKLWLTSWEEGRVLLGKSLQSALGVWSDSVCVRRMEGRYHLWLCQLLVLGTTCLLPHITTPTSSDLRGGVMRGLQAHLDNPEPGVRERGMATGQCLMNCLHSAPKEQQLHFDLAATSDVETILQLSRPVREQQLELEAVPAPFPAPHCGGEEGHQEEGGGDGGSFGTGMVSVTEASHSDSDDELEPFEMSHDPDHTHPPAPRYLRDCLEALVSQSDRGAVEVTLTSLPSLISSQPHDLSDVCVELARALLHLQDNDALRHTALIALTTTRPHLLTPFLTKEFYSPNHSLRQRLDILEVLSSAATKLSTPSPLTTSTLSPISPHTPSQTKKPWQQLIDERVKAKTRTISKGPQKPPAPATPSKFSPVAPLFLFPLMAPYDHAHPTLDLLGQDSMLLGHLVQTLGNVVWCSCHAPSEPAMARALLEFIWALRYHPSSFVRQAVLCALTMTVVATPTDYLLSDMHEAIVEAILWVQDVAGSDGNDDIRTLASHTLSTLSSFT